MITVATWNINSIKARQSNVLTWLQERAADLVLLQEIKTTTETFPLETFEALGYHATVHGQPSYNGVAILSREPITLIASALPGDQDDGQARFLDIEWRNTRFINIYAPNGNPLGTEKFVYKLQWLDRLYAYVQNLRANRIPFAIGGDFNIIPKDIDARIPDEWLGDALYQPESQAQWRRLCHLGLTDAFRAMHGDVPRHYTFWDYQAGSWQRDNGIRIDHFLLSPSLADRLVSCEIDKEPRGREKPSDHTPVIITLA